MGNVNIMKEKYSKLNSLKVSTKLLEFVNNELLKNTSVNPKKFWVNFEKAIYELTPINKKLLKIRESLQKQIDEWHIKNKGNEFDLIEYKKFLKKIGYLVETDPDFVIKTKNVDKEISSIAGPQLVVPIMNERYALNAANARWVSLHSPGFVRNRFRYRIRCFHSSPK